MRNTGIIVAAVVVLVVGFVLATGGDDKGSGTSAGTATTTETAAPAATSAGTAAAPAPEVKTVTVKDGKPEGGVQRLAYDKGDTVRFRIDSDTADEIHVHGYDLMKDVEAGGSVAFTFPAKFDGKYEVELEDAGVQIASLEIQP